MPAPILPTVRRVPGSRPGRLDPAGTLRIAASALPHDLGLHQQAADTALSRRCADRRVLRHGDHARRPGAPARPRPRRYGSPISCRPSAMPYRNLVGKVFDSGDYPEVAAPRGGGIRSRRHPRATGQGRGVGFGLATFCEQGAHGTSVYHAWGIPFVPGFEQAPCAAESRRRAGSARGCAQPRPGNGDDAGAGRARDPGCPSRQGARGSRRHRAHALFDGHLGQPSMVMAGGAVAEACRQLAERIGAIGAALLQVSASEVEVANGKVRRRTPVAR